MRTPSVFALAASLLAVLATEVAHATSFNLRGIEAYRNWGSNPDPQTASASYEDFFNNTTLQTGGTYSGGFTTPATLYGVIGGSAPAEASPGDFSIPGGGPAIGRVSFVQANANAAIVFSVNGVDTAIQSYRLNLNGPTGNSFFSAQQDKFLGTGFFDFATPLEGERYGVRFTDAVNTATAYNDAITFDVVRMSNGAPGIQMRRLTSPGGLSFSTSDVQTVAVSSFLAPGKTLANVDIVGLNLFWEADLNGFKRVFGRVELVDFTSPTTVESAGEYTFSSLQYEIFRGETFTNFQVGASWSGVAAVPEPASVVLMLAGAVGVLGWSERARRRG